jgi:hypothetical protein
VWDDLECLLATKWFRQTSPKRLVHNALERLSRPMHFILKLLLNVRVKRQGRAHLGIMMPGSQRSRRTLDPTEI